MSIFKWTTEPKKIYFWVEYKTLTYTLDQTQSNPANMVTATSPDAISMSANDVVDFIGAYPVLLDNSWNEYRKLNPSNFKQFDDWTDASSYVGWGNYDVMIKFPRRWYKISTTNNITTFSLTDEPNNPEYCYAPFQRLSSWTLWASGAVYTDASAFYLGAYQWYVLSSKLRSWYWYNPTGNKTIWDFTTYAKNVFNDGLGGITEFLQEFYLQLCYLAIFKNPFAQNVLWWWITWYSYTSTVPNSTAWVNSYDKIWSTTSSSWAISLCYWTSSTQTPIVFLWLEQWYGSVNEFLWWWGKTSAGVHISIPTTDWSNRSTPSYTPTWYTTVGTTSASSWQNISKVMWSTYWWFTPTATVSNSSYNTYFTDNVWIGSWNWLACHSWPFDQWAKCWMFYYALDVATSTKANNMWARLMYLPNGDL